MKVREIMSTHVQRISSSAMVSEAAEKMRIFDIGALPVLEENKIVGMLTDRDIVIRAIATGLDPKMTVIKDVFTPNVFCCSQEDDIETAARIMEDNQVRRLVVLGDDNSVVGMLSLGDLALKTSVDHLAFEILEKVCEPTRG
jgi:CBS domain-containing protein